MTFEKRMINKLNFGTHEFQSHTRIPKKNLLKNLNGYIGKKFADHFKNLKDNIIQ